MSLYDPVVMIPASQDRVAVVLAISVMVAGLLRLLRRLIR